MDHSRSLRPVHHDQLKKSPCAINAEKKVPNGVFGDLLDDQGVAHNVFNVFRVVRFDVGPERRAEDLHGQSRAAKPPSLADLGNRGRSGMTGQSAGSGQSSRWGNTGGLNDRGLIGQPVGQRTAGIIARSDAARATVSGV